MDVFVQILGSVVGVGVSMFIGYLIGRRKGRAGLGAVLGILGCIGWIIVAVLPKKEPTFGDA